MYGNQNIKSPPAAWQKDFQQIIKVKRLPKTAMLHPQDITAMTSAADALIGENVIVPRMGIER